MEPPPTLWFLKPLLWLCRFSCAANLMPFKYNCAVRLLEERRGLRSRLWKSTFYVGVALNVFIQFRFLQSCFQPPPRYFVMDVAIHATIGWLGVATNVYAYNAFVKWPSVTRVLHRSMMESGIGQRRTGSFGGNLSERPGRKFSIYQLVIFALPTSVPTIGLIMSVAQAIRFDSPAFLWSVVPKEYQSETVFYVLFGIESFYRCFWISYGIYGATGVVAMLERTSWTFATAQYTAQYAAQTTLKLLRKLQLEMLFLNLLTGQSNYAVKIYALMSSIIGYSTTFYYFSEDPFIALVNIVYSSEVSVAYMAMYARAYNIPAGVSALKRATLRSAKAGEVNYVEKRVKAFQSCAMKMGDFHVVERETALTYWDFVVRQISVILISLNQL